MKKLLYISCNSKPENISTSRTVGKEFVNRFIAHNPDYEWEELDIYNEDIPEINHRIFTARSELASGEQYDKLSQEDKADVDRVNQLCDQFLSADIYVIAAPMWSVFFPARLKRYIDCVIINNKSIKITKDEVSGLLGDKERKMVYIQSSGGDYPWLLSLKHNHGVSYLKDVFKFLGFEKFEELLVEGTGSTESEKQEAIEKAFKEMDRVIAKLKEKVFI